MKHIFIILLFMPFIGKSQTIQKMAKGDISITRTEKRNRSEITIKEVIKSDSIKLYIVDLLRDMEQNQERKYRIAQEIEILTEQLNQLNEKQTKIQELISKLTK